MEGRETVYQKKKSDETEETVKTPRYSDFFGGEAKKSQTPAALPRKLGGRGSRGN